MCTGEIVAPAGMPKDTTKGNFSLMEYLKVFWERITCNENLDEPKDNMCPKCGDLQVNDVWLKTPYPQREIIMMEIHSGRIAINGWLKRCDSCRLSKKVNKEKRKSRYKNAANFLYPRKAIIHSIDVLSVSTQSF